MNYYTQEELEKYSIETSRQVTALIEVFWETRDVSSLKLAQKTLNKAKRDGECGGKFLLSPWVNQMEETLKECWLAYQYEPRKGRRNGR